MTRILISAFSVGSSSSARLRARSGASGGLRQEGIGLRSAGAASFSRRDHRRRSQRGWVRAGPAAYGDDAVRARLVEAALGFVRGLPPKG
jgi:hypothetical protein